MFANTQMMGMDASFPDVCNTPTPPPVPIPYPNVAMGPMGVPAAYNVLLMMAPAHNMLTTIPMTNGDNVGVLMGVPCPTVMGPARNITASFTTLILGAPATRLTSVSLQNTFNSVGARVVPSQPKVIILAP